jgi:4-hydroxybenzoate polyprenyltransferase
MNTSADNRRSRLGVVGALIASARPTHWVKNAFVLAPLLFSDQFRDPAAMGRALLALASFCLLSSGVYLINDVLDRKQDLLHPVKRLRPIPSGQLGVGGATGFGAICFIVGLALPIMMGLHWPSDTLSGQAVLAWAMAYVVLNMLYSTWLKHHPIVDVIVIATGFVFRAMAGAAAINVLPSPWLVVCTFTLCLFIALTKRRAEVQILGEDAAQTRKSNAAYELRDLDVMIGVSASMALITYALYCLSPHTVDVTVGSANMIWTIPLVVYGVFRFNRLTRTTGRDPVAMLVGDRAMWAVVVLYVLLAGAIVWAGDHDSFQILLHDEAAPIVP